MIDKVLIRNYRRMRDFELTLNDGLNVLVGNNDTGKSTVIEAINLALTGRLNGRWLSDGLTPYLVNQAATAEYVAALASEQPKPPPTVVIEVFFKDLDGEFEVLRGTNNLTGEDACGVRIQAVFNADFHDEYEAFVGMPEHVRLVPTEYYKVEWLGFSVAQSPAAVSRLPWPSSTRPAFVFTRVWTTISSTSSGHTWSPESASSCRASTEVFGRSSTTALQ